MLRSGRICRLLLLLLLLLLLCGSVSCDTCEECPPAGEGSGGWNSQLMVCNIGSRNATLMWNQDTAASNTTYEVVYQDIDDRGNPIRSEPISGEETVLSHAVTDLTPNTTYEVQVCQVELDTCGNCLVVFSTLVQEVPGKVMNVRVYVYNPVLGDNETITALIVWDALTPEEAGSVINHYNVSIREVGTDKKIVASQTTGNESYFIVREFGPMVSVFGIPFYNVLSYPLQRNKSYEVQVLASNDGGDGPSSDTHSFSTESVSPPQQVLVATSDGLQLHGSGISRSYEAVSPLTVNTISRHIYWYNSTTDCVMMQSLDGTEISVLIQSPPIIVSSMAYEWQGERLYMIGRNQITRKYELWRAPIVYSKGIERVYQLSEPVQSVCHLIVDSFRQGAAYWLQVEEEGTHLMYLNLSNPLSALQLSGSRMRRQASSNLTHLGISALTLDPSTGDLWVSDDIDGGIFSCDTTSGSCQEVVDAARSGTSIISIGLDEETIYWTDGSIVSSVSRAAPTNSVSSSNIFGVTALLSLSPGQQPQYISCREGRTCLAPDIIFSLTNSLPPVQNMTVTNTSLEVWWGLPSLEACCAAVVFSYPLVQYRYKIDTSFVDSEDPFDTHLRRDNLKPFTSYDVSLQYLNLYTLRIIENVDFNIRVWLNNVKTDPGVPDPIETQDFRATPFGVTCIGVDWTASDKIRGPMNDLSFFVTINGSSSDPLTVNVSKSNAVLLHDYTTVKPGNTYDIEVKVSNGVFNSSGVSMGNIISWPQAPPPVASEISNTSFTVMIALEERHMDITSLFIKAIGNDGVVYNSSAKNVTDVPVTIFFDFFNVSSFTKYNVRAVATYANATFAGACCRTTMYDGEGSKLRTDSGVPDAPEVFISSGIAYWNQVNPRSSGSVSYHLTALTPDMMLVGEIDIDIPTGNVAGIIMQDLSVGDLNLQVDVEYTICVTAKNEIGESDPGCVQSYIHMVTPESSSSGLSRQEYTGIGVGGFFAILAVVAVIIFILCVVVCVRKRRGKQTLARLAYAYGPDLELTSVRAQRYFRTNTSGSNQNMWSREDFIATEEELAQLNQFPRHHLKLQTFLGQGEFGEVFQGTAHDILGPGTGPHPVAIKTVHKGATTDERQKFLSEAALLGKFNHENIVKILAVCVDNDPVFIIMELMPAADLLKFIREARSESGPALLTREEQLHITLDVAHGCYYLEQQHFIHRDIAARNCLVSSKGADRVVKIGDFGLAKDLYSSDYYRVEGERKLPVRWMAPEALLQGRFTIESDVWAYGILLHEVMTFGDQPYPGQSNQNVLQFVTAGGRLPRPKNCPLRMYHLMMQCWREYPSERPHFEEVCNTLDSILEDIHRESYCDSAADSDDEADTVSRDSSKQLSSKNQKSGFQNLVRTGSKKLRNSLRRHSGLQKDEQTAQASVDSIPEIGPI